ncbi:MAG TPA: protein kinase [Candidatus Eisenbacteria bacterium]|nr:protein kinase [Candidatus Eisenbacteria bacterium]
MPRRKSKSRDRQPGRASDRRSNPPAPPSVTERPTDESSSSSRFQLGAPLGVGGMSQVVAAIDLRLGRPVAIKTLRQEFVSDPQRVARMRREARALGKLHHPNIAMIYSSEVNRRGERLLILEKVEGESLLDRLKHGPLDVGTALRIGAQIASALEAAHLRGVVHRDLKPANVMVTPQGVAKVLDFGLAKITTDDEPGSDTVDLVMPGVAVGTPGYMSPEQVRGLGEDRRSDVFGFGCTLYECLTGARAYGGTPRHAMEAVLRRDPNWSLLPPETPEEIRDLLRSCCERDTGKRLHDMAVARGVLERCSVELDRAAGRPARLDETTRRLGPRLLPDPGTSFVGRERERGEVGALLRRHRLLTLTGAGGAGKSRLALAVAVEAQAELRDGVWWIDLAYGMDAERVPSAVASALGVRERAGVWILDTLEDYLASRSLLLVLDCCEHVLGACRGFAEVLLPRAPELRILATSREPLKVPGEHVYRVPPLAEGVRLFLERAAMARPDFHPTERERDGIEEICRRLDGLPLAIELAAARVPVLSIHEMREKLLDPLRLLAAGAPSPEARHQTLAATIGWSYDLLRPEEQRFFRALSVFVGGWSLESASEVAQGDEFEVLDLLSRLVDKSLVVTEPGGGERLRFRMLDTVRQYALGRLRTAGEERSTRLRHLEYFVGLSRRATAGLVGEEQGAWLDRLEEEHENFLSAFWCCGQIEGGAISALRMASSLWRFWFGHGHFELGRSVLATELNLPGAKAPTSERAAALLGAGALAFHQNDFAAGDAAYEESLAIYRAMGDEAGIALSLGGFGNLRMSQGRLEEARAAYEDALARFRRAGHRRGEGLMLSNLGRLALFENDRERGRDLSRQGIDIFREVGDVGSLALRLTSLAELSLSLGRTEEARALLMEGIEVVREQGEPHPAAYALERSAALLAALGDPVRAARLCGAADALRTQIASPRSPKEKEDLDQFLVGVQREAGGMAFGEAWSAGLSVPYEVALDEALRALGAVEVR